MIRATGSGVIAGCDLPIHMCEQRGRRVNSAWPSQSNVLCDVTFEAAQTVTPVTLLDLESADVQRCWVEPARHSMPCLNVGIRKFFVEMIALLKLPSIFHYTYSMTPYTI